MPKYLSVEDANRTLPMVRRIVSDILATHRELVEMVKEYGHLDPELESLKAKRHELEEEMRELTDQVNGYIDELEKIGGLFKGFEGLVDFPAVLDGRPILLCWKLGEDRIEWWHELDAGYTGRQRLPAHMLERGASAPETSEKEEPKREGPEPEAEDTGS
jgi:hypothetical protein